jgi:hypothetical protein
MDRRNFLKMMNAFGVTAFMPTDYLLKGGQALAQVAPQKHLFVFNTNGGLNWHHIVNMPEGVPAAIRNTSARIPDSTGTYRNLSTQMTDFFTNHGQRTMSVFYNTESNAHPNSRNNTHTNTQDASSDAIWSQFIRHFGPTQAMATFFAGRSNNSAHRVGALNSTNVDAQTGPRLANVLSPAGVNLNTMLSIIEKGDPSKAGFSRPLQEQLKASVDDQKKLINAAAELSASTDPVDLWTTAVSLGMSSLCVYSIDGCDTHSDADAITFNGANGKANIAFSMASNVIAKATEKGFVNDLMIVFTGDFCRTLAFNNTNGTQHNSNSQSLIWAGNNFNLRYPGGVFGAYGSRVSDIGRTGGTISPTTTQFHEGLKNLWGMPNNGTAKYSS